jgi:dienelactone hydrolase
MINVKSRIAIPSVLFLTLFFAVVYVNAEEWVKFNGKTMMGEELPLAGMLNVPKGKGPFPAVVMLCGCGGLRNEGDAKQQKTWARLLMSWGYVSLQVDSFGPRGYDSICDMTSKVSDGMRALDAYSAKSYLAKLKYVDAKNIAVIGWSHGGWTIMRIVEGWHRDKDVEPFRAAIAFYPWCDSFLTAFDTPLLILIGEKDDWCPADRCETFKNLEIVRNSKYECKLKIYPNVYHSFDFKGLKADMFGHHVEYNPEATTDAIAQTREFLAKYLKTAK